MAHQHSSQNGSAVAEKPCDPPTEDGAALAEKLIRGALPWEEHGAAPDALRPTSTPQITEERPTRAAQSFEMALAPATPESLSPREPELSSASASPDDSAASSAYSVDDLSARSQSVTSTPTDRHATSLRELLSRDHPQSAPPLHPHQQQQGTGLSVRRRSHRFSSGCTSVPTETLTYPGVQALRRQGSLSLARRLHSSCDNLTSLDYTAPQPTASTVPPPPVAAERSSGPKRHSLGERRHSVSEPSGDSRTSTEYTTTTTAHMRNSQGRRVSVSLRKREVPPPPPPNPTPYHRTSPSLTHNPRAPPIKPRHQESRERRSKLSSIKNDVVKNNSIKNDSVKNGGKAKDAVKVRAEIKNEGKAESKAVSKAAPNQETGELFSIPGLIDAVTSVFSQFISCSCEAPGGSSSRPQ